MVCDLEAPEVLGAGNPFVVGKLVAHKQHDEDGTSQPHRQPRDVDETVELVPGEVAQRGDEIIAEHNGSYS